MIFYTVERIGIEIQLRREDTLAIHLGVMISDIGLKG